MFIRRGGERFARKQKQSLEEVNTYTKGYSSKIKVFTHHEIVDRIPEKLVSMITQMYEKSKLWKHANLWLSIYRFIVHNAFNHLFKNHLHLLFTFLFSLLLHCMQGIYPT